MPRFYTRNLVIHSTKHLLRACCTPPIYYILDSVVDVWVISVNKKENSSCPHGAWVLAEGDRQQTVNVIRKANRLLEGYSITEKKVGNAEALEISEVCHFIFAVLCGLWDLSSQPGLKPVPLQWKCRVLTTDPQGIPWSDFLKEDGALRVDWAGRPLWRLL